MDSMSKYGLKANRLPEQKTALDFTPVCQEQHAETIVGPVEDWKNVTIFDKS